MPREQTARQMSDNLTASERAVRSISEYLMEESIIQDMLFDEPETCRICGSILHGHMCTNEFHDQSRAYPTGTIEINNREMVISDSDGIARVTVGSINSQRTRNSNPFDTSDYRRFAEQYNQYMSRRGGGPSFDTRPHASIGFDLNQIENRLITADMPTILSGQVNIVNNTIDRWTNNNAQI